MNGFLPHRANPIEHIFVLMLENRSFDHFLGGLPGVDGADARRFNVDRDGNRYYQLPGASPATRPDPKDGLSHVLTQLDPPGDLGSMGGFVLDYSQSYPATTWLQRAEIMSYFRDGDLPALHALAKDFVICQQWFASVPGPAWANRFFAHSGTSSGIVRMPEPPIDWNLHDYDQITLYDRLSEAGVPWRIYYGDVPQSVLLTRQRRPSRLGRYRQMRKFTEDMARKESEIPAYVFIEPNYLGSTENDDHPPTNVSHGQALIAQVYNAIRLNRGLWMKSLLVITWDEHGGFYDHVNPRRASPPDSRHDEYSFDRYGARVPTLLISPWFPADVDNTLFDHTSILRFAQTKWNLGSLGARVANANSFEHLLLARPRRHTPTSIPSDRLDSSELLRLARDLQRPETELNQNQLALIAFGEHLDHIIDDAPENKQRRLSRMATSDESRIAVTVERYERLLGEKTETRRLNTGATEDGLRSRVRP